MPKITAVTPNTGVAGTPIKIQGEGFGPARGSSLLEIGGKNVVTASWSDEEITCQIPNDVSETPHIRVFSLGAGSSGLWQFNPPAPKVVPVKSPADGSVTAIKPPEKPADKVEVPKTA